MAKIETQELFTTAINDVQADVRGKSDAYMLSVVRSIVERYEEDPLVSLELLADEYDVQKVLFPQNEAFILHKEIHELKSENLRLKIKIFYNKFVKKHADSSKSNEYICRDENSKEDIAVLLTLAYTKNMPAVSIVYDNSFICDSFAA